MHDFPALRQRMVDNQIRPSEVTDPPLIQAFLAIPRERFMAPDQQPFAYSDREIRLSGEERTSRLMLDPVQLARMIQALKITPQSNVLDVGSGTGYTAALLSRMAAQVTALEEDPVLARIAVTNLRDLNASNVAVVTGRLTEGHPAAAPFDAILVNGAVDAKPERLAGQLKVGGLMVVIERQERISRAMLYERVSTDVTRWPLFEAWTAQVLPGFERAPEFVF